MYPLVRVPVGQPVRFVRVPDGHLSRSASAQRQQDDPAEAEQDAEVA